MGKCFFIGHEFVWDQIKYSLAEGIIEYIVNCGVTEFYVSDYGTFDKIIINTLIDMKKMYPHIKNYRVLAYPPADKQNETPEDFEDTFIMQWHKELPRDITMAIFKRRMIRYVDHLIIYFKFIPDNTLNLMKYIDAQCLKRKLLTMYI